jgi:hypothetical protein
VLDQAFRDTPGLLVIAVRKVIKIEAVQQAASALQVASRAAILANDGLSPEA